MNGVLDRLMMLVGKELALRDNPEIVPAVFAELGVSPSEAFVQFHTRYAGQSGSQSVPYELSDLVEDPWSVKNSTLDARKSLGLPKQFLILSPVFGGAILALDANNEAVYDADLESGVDEMIGGNLAPKWSYFESFVEHFFIG